MSKSIIETVNFFVYITSKKTNFTNIKEKAWNDIYRNLLTSLFSCIIILRAVFDNDPMGWLWVSEYTGYRCQSQKTRIPHVLVVLLIHYQTMYLRPEIGKKVMQIQLYKNVLTFSLKACLIREYQRIPASLETNCILYS